MEKRGVSKIIQALPQHVKTNDNSITTVRTVRSWMSKCLQYSPIILGHPPSTYRILYHQHSPNNSAWHLGIQLPGGFKFSLPSQQVPATTLNLGVVNLSPCQAILEKGSRRWCRGSFENSSWGHYWRQFLQVPVPGWGPFEAEVCVGMWRNQRGKSIVSCGLSASKEVVHGKRYKIHRNTLIESKFLLHHCWTSSNLDPANLH